jgi:hypothetical protein
MWQEVAPVMSGSLTKWLMAGALGAGFVMGCNHSRPACVCRVTAKPETACVAKNDASPQHGYICHAPSGTKETCVSRPQPAVAASASTQAVVAPPAPATPAQVVLPPAEVPAPPAVRPPSVYVPSAPSKPVSIAEKPAIKEPLRQPERVATQPETTMAHADDYSWLCGRISRDFKNPNTWRLRYLSLDQTDDYGGALTLAEDESLRNLKDGMCVKVWGRVHEASGPSGTTTYFADRVTIVKP